MPSCYQKKEKVSTLISIYVANIRYKPGNYFVRKLEN